jgi:HEAT repeat protein
LTTISACSADAPEVQVDPLEVLGEFYAYDGAEDTLMDPLIVAGTDVVPMVLEQVVKPDMVKRRYAIQALGNIGDPAAIPTLKLLAESTEEPGYIRCVSTQAVAQIDWIIGRDLAQQFTKSGQQDSPECLPRISNQILNFSREEWLEKTGIVRSLEDARKRKHY